MFLSERVCVCVSVNVVCFLNDVRNSMRVYGKCMVYGTTL